MKPSKRAALDLEVSRFLSTNFEVMSRTEASTLGLTDSQIRDRLESGAWTKVFRGVYRSTAASLGPLSYLRAALLVAGPSALVSHWSAAWLHDMIGTAPGRPMITAPHSRFPRVHGIDVVRSRRPPKTVTRKGLRCSAPIQTLVDCAAIATPEELDALVDQALARKVIEVADLERGAGHRAFRNHPGRRLYVQRLEARGISGSPNPSVLESRAARLFQGKGLPVPTAEVEWTADRRHYRLDFAYPHLRLVIEVDGWASHMSPEQQRYDNVRNNALALRGWTVLHYNWWDITFDGERVAAEILQAYRRLAA